MCDPRFQPVVLEEVQVCSNHVGEGPRSLLVGNGGGEESRIVVTQDVVVPRLMEILEFLRLVQAILLPQRIGVTVVDEAAMIGRVAGTRGIGICQGHKGPNRTDEGQQAPRDHFGCCWRRRGLFLRRRWETLRDAVGKGSSLGSHSRTPWEDTERGSRDDG